MPTFSFGCSQARRCVEGLTIVLLPVGGWAASLQLTNSLWDVVPAQLCVCVWGGGAHTHTHTHIHKHIDLGNELPWPSLYVGKIQRDIAMSSRLTPKTAKPFSQTVVVAASSGEDAGAQAGGADAAVRYVSDPSQFTDGLQTACNILVLPLPPNASGENLLHTVRRICEWHNDGFSRVWLLGQRSDLDLYSFCRGPPSPIVNRRMEAVRSALVRARVEVFYLDDEKRYARVRAADTSAVVVMTGSGGAAERIYNGYMNDVEGKVRVFARPLT